MTIDCNIWIFLNTGTSDRALIGLDQLLRYLHSFMLHQGAQSSRQQEVVGDI